MGNKLIMLLEKEVNKGLKELELEYERRKNAEIAATLGLDLIERIGKNKERIIFNGEYNITLDEVDEYNNIYLTFHNEIPCKVLIRIAIYFEITEKNKDTYDDGRIFAACLINYFEKYFYNIDLEYLLCMLHNGKLKQSSFKEWFIGEKYTSGGNIRYFEYDYTKTQIKEALKGTKEKYLIS